jgi:hypothetical protein
MGPNAATNGVERITNDGVLIGAHAVPEALSGRGFPEG